MEKLNVVSKKLGVSKGKIKDMCKSDDVTFTIINGIYYVDENEIKEKLKENSFKRKNTIDRRFYKSIIPSDMTYISRVSDNTDIDGRWMNEIVNNIIGYWNDVGRNHKVLEFIESLCPIQYRLLPISLLKNKSDYEDLFGGKLDDNSMFIWIKHYDNFSMKSINLFDGSFQSHSYKKEFKIGILNPSTKRIKVFDIDTIIYNVEDEINWYEVIKNYTIDEKIVDYNTTKILDIGILSKPIGTSYLIVTNNTNVIRWVKKETHKSSNNKSYEPNTKSQHTVKGFWRKQPYGSRSNPKYKMIWIESFERCGKKVG